MSGFNGAQGYAASLRQQATWIDETVNATVPVHSRIDLGDVDTDELRAAADFIDRFAPGWRPIASVPKDGMSVDLWCRNISHGSTGQTRFSDMFVNADGKWEDWHGYILEPKWQPTHWMPLPSAPEAQP